MAALERENLRADECALQLSVLPPTSFPLDAAVLHLLQITIGFRDTQNWIFRRQAALGIVLLAGICSSPSPFSPGQLLAWKFAKDSKEVPPAKHRSERGNGRSEVARRAPRGIFSWHYILSLSFLPHRPTKDEVGLHESRLVRLESSAKKCIV